MEGSVRPDGHSGGNGHADIHVGCSRVEFLGTGLAVQMEAPGSSWASIDISGAALTEECRCVRTLQKSIDLTPLLPSAGPTGGLGLAWPAPTINFTI